MVFPRVYLIPQFLFPQSPRGLLPQASIDAMAPLRFFIVEERAAAQRFLKRIVPGFPLPECQFLLFNEHTEVKEIASFFNAAGPNDIGVISEAGAPCVADPGSEIVLEAHRQGREVVPLVGPSSILLALMASGLNGQNFAFNGYLPKDRCARIKKIKELELRSREEHQTEIFMETPYRNQNLFTDLLATCNPATFLCIAMELTAPTQIIRTHSVGAWQCQKLDLHKKPALFLILGDK